MIGLEINGKDYFLAESLHEITVNDGIRLEAWQLENKPKGDDEIAKLGHFMQEFGQMVVDSDGVPIGDVVLDMPLTQAAGLIEYTGNRMKREMDEIEPLPNGGTFEFEGEEIIIFSQDETDWRLGDYAYANQVKQNYESTPVRALPYLIAQVCRPSSIGVLEYNAKHREVYVKKFHKLTMYQAYRISFFLTSSARNLEVAIQNRTDQAQAILSPESAD